MACGASSLLLTLQFTYFLVTFDFSPQCTHGSLEDPKSVTHHKLIHAASERVLSDAKTVLEENIHDHGESRGQRWERGGSPVSSLRLGPVCDGISVRTGRNRHRTGSVPLRNE